MDLKLSVAAFFQHTPTDIPVPDVAPLPEVPVPVEGVDGVPVPVLECGAAPTDGDCPAGDDFFGLLEDGCVVAPGTGAGEPGLGDTPLPVGAEVDGLLVGLFVPLVVPSEHWGTEVDPYTMTRYMTSVLSVIAFSLVGGLTGCETQADRDKLANDQMQFRTALQEQDNAMADQLHRLQVKRVYLTQGEVAADQMKICFLDSGYAYPRRANLDGSERHIDLSRRVLIQCDHIMEALARYDAKQAAEEKRKDADYDRTHPTPATPRRP